MKNLKFIVVIAFMLTMGFAGCDGRNEEEDDQSAFDISGMLTNYADNIILPNYVELTHRIHKLQEKTILFIENPTSSSLVDLQQSLFDAQLGYQRCTSFEFGPANNHALRAILSTYPTSISIINNNISSGQYNLYAAGNIAAIGFPALDYLLYGNQKTPQEIVDLFTINPNANQRVKYLNDVISQCVNSVELVNGEWVNGGYSQVFINANGYAVGSSVSLMLNTMVLDFERFIRDGKIGIPVGVRTLGVPNPERVEAYYSKVSLELVKESITQYKKAFNGISQSGENGVGFDDYLAYEGGATIAANISSQLDQVLLKLKVLNGPLSVDVVNNKAQVNEVYAELQKTIVLLKVEMPSALSVLITYQDSDGD